MDTEPKVEPERSFASTVKQEGAGSAGQQQQQQQSSVDKSQQVKEGERPIEKEQPAQDRRHRIHDKQQLELRQNEIPSASSQDVPPLNWQQLQQQQQAGGRPRKRYGRRYRRWSHPHLQQESSEDAGDHAEDPHDATQQVIANWSGQEEAVAAAQRMFAAVASNDEVSSSVPIEQMADMKNLKGQQERSGQQGQEDQKHDSSEAPDRDDRREQQQPQQQQQQEAPSSRAQRSSRAVEREAASADVDGEAASARESKSLTAQLDAFVAPVVRMADGMNSVRRLSSWRRTLTLAAAGISFGLKVWQRLAHGEKSHNVASLMSVAIFTVFIVAATVVAAAALALPGLLWFVLDSGRWIWNQVQSIRRLPARWAGRGGQRDEGDADWTHEWLAVVQQLPDMIDERVSVGWHELKRRVFGDSDQV